MRRTSLWRSIACLAGIPALAFLIGYLTVWSFPGCVLGIAVVFGVPLAAGALAPHLSRRTGVWAAAASALAVFAGTFVASLDQHVKLAAGYGWWHTLKGLAVHALIAVALALAVAVPVTRARRREEA